MRYNHAQGQMTYQIEVDKNGRTGFDYGCDFMSTGKLGALIPTQAMRVTYGDRANDKVSAGVQLEPLAVPMMANMFIKQEHYYTPYNCVWRNYDNWRSGGEGLMYGEEFLTPVPSFTIKQVMDLIKSYFSNLLTLVYNPDGVANGAAYTVFLQKSSFINSLPTVKASLKNGFSILGVSDIYEHYIAKTLKEIEDLVNNYDFTKQPGYIEGVTSTDLIPFFQQEYIVGDGDYNNVRLPQDYKLPSEWQMLYDNYNAISARWQFNNLPSEPLLPNEFAVKICYCIYKLYKPFVGIGSYLDTLNINRILPVDLYYGFLYRVLSTINSQLSGEVIFSFYPSSNVYSDVSINVLNLRVLYLIWYNNYRDQLLETSARRPIDSDFVTSDEILTLLIPRHRCWDKDTYTTALDNPATADAVVPLNAQSVQTRSQEVVGAGADEVSRNDKDIYEIVFKDGEKFRLPTNFLHNYSPQEGTQSADKGYFSLSLLDAAKRAQKFFRKAVYYGNRIQDFVYLNWQVKHLDARLRLPELLGVSQDTVTMSTLVNNTTTAESVAGDRAGYAYGTDKGAHFDRFCEEDGVVISLFTLMPQPTYGYGTDRQYACLDRFDMPLPDFSTLGMDAVYDNEIMALPTLVWNKERMALSDMPNVFGYQGRYYSEKWRPSTEHGELLTTQDMFTFGRRFNPYDADGRPVLNYEFVHCFPSTDMFVMEDGREDVFRFSVYHDCYVDRTLPYHSIYF